MYAVIRSGGKQYRVAPGDVIRVEKLASAKDNGSVQFGEVLAISGSDGQIGRPQSEALVTGRVLGEVRGDKVLVFHYKRKKQYKKLRGHRQSYTTVRIMEISFDGQRFTAPEGTQKAPKPKKPARLAAEAEAEVKSEHAQPKHAQAKHADEKPASKAKAQASGAAGAGKKTVGKRGGASSKSAGSKAKGGSPKKRK
jgi:large subunit ribosomal protein L21